MKLMQLCLMKIMRSLHWWAKIVGEMRRHALGLLIRVELAMIPVLQPAIRQVEGERKNVLQPAIRQVEGERKNVLPQVARLVASNQE